MAKRKLRNSTDISKGTNLLFNIIGIFIVILCVFPVLYVISISISTKQSIAEHGYQLIPSEVTFESYKQLLSGGTSVVRAFFNQVFVTVVGTLVGLIVITSYAYAMSRNDFRFRKFFNTLAFIPMLFSGGMVANYLIMKQVLKLSNTPFALILPLLFNTFYLIIMRTFFQTSVPFTLIEAAMIDGASEFQIFFKIVLPISLPGIATIALFLTIAYWNDWFNAMLYIDPDNQWTTLQYLLIKVQKTIELVILKGSSMGSAAQDALKTLPSDGVRMAIVVIATLPIALSYPFFQKYFISGLTLGAVKE